MGGTHRRRARRCARRCLRHWTIMKLIIYFMTRNGHPARFTRPPSRQGGVCFAWCSGSNVRECKCGGSEIRERNCVVEGATHRWGWVMQGSIGDGAVHTQTTSEAVEIYGRRVIAARSSARSLHIPSQCRLGPWMAARALGREVDRRLVPQVEVYRCHRHRRL